MRISLGDLDYYRDALNQIAAQASGYVRESVQSSAGGVTAVREAAIEALQYSVGIHGEMGQALASQLFDEVCAADGMGPYDFELYDDIIDFELLESKVRYYAKALVEHDEGRYLDDCATLADFYVRRCNYESMVRNCHQNNVRYARIPTGADTCDFCMMLASRGFVYYSQTSAEEGMHANCDCIAVPGGATDAAQVEGYDPDMLYGIWQSRISDTANNRAARNGTSYQIERMKIMDRYSRASRQAKVSRRLR